MAEGRSCLLGNGHCIQAVTERSSQRLHLWTSLPLACAVVLVTRAESQCWVPERPGGVGSHFLPGTLLPSNRPPPPSFAPPPASSNTWFRRLPGPGRGDIGARAQPLHSQVVPGTRAQGARGGLQDARAGGAGSRGDRAGSGAARRSWGHGRHLAGPGNSGRWPAIEWASGVPRATETLMQPGVETSLCVLFYFIL